MTDLAVDARITETLSRVESAAGAVATLLGAAIAGGTPLDAGPGDEQGHARELLPGESCSGVAIDAADGSGDRLFLLVSDAALAAGGEGAAPTPLGALLESAARSISLPVGGEASLDGPAQAEAGLSVEEGARLFAAGLFLGGEHVATVGMLIRSTRTMDDVTPGAPAPAADPGAPLRLLADVEMCVTAELGRARLTVAELLALTPGAVVELDRAAGAPVDLLVNGTLIARGEVVVVDERFAVRVIEIIGGGASEAAAR